MLLLLAAAAALATVRFHDVTAEAGVRFTLDNAPSAEKHMIETMAGGLATFDYDGDGLTDIFFTNGAAVPSMDKSAARYWNRLYRNEGNWKFRDVTEAAGVKGDGYSMGAAAGDFDNDGRVDLFVAGVYRNALYRNLGNGKFEEVPAARSGIKSDRWSVTAGWFDYDNDGLLDLLVINYSHWAAKGARFCGDMERGVRVYCHPQYFDPVPNQLYRNKGGGVFEDVSVASGIAAHKGRGMGVAFADYDGDRRVDTFVTNDNLANFLFRNLGNGKFEETALLAGAALPDNGKPVSSMGADWRDYDGDGKPDIVVTALAGETYPLYRNDGTGGFRDATHLSKLAALTGKHSGWGVGWVDFNNDGWRDLFTANSHVNDLVEKFEAYKYKEPNSVFLNRGDGTFTDAGFGGSPRAHRGAAFADFDNDGRMDIVVTALGEAATVWRNVTEPAGHWLRVTLEGATSNRDGIGARVVIGGQTGTTSTARTSTAMMSTAVSYSSSSHYGLHFGLGAVEGLLTVVVEWPSGAVQRLEGVKPDQVLRVKEPAAR
ncbi:MAG: CRTAC1 family protein [Bryobacterales bacterium]|nr:CRTAC1 family protein [Bryobacterales bacterium]